MESSDFFAAIYSEGGRLFRSEQDVRCYDIPIKAMKVIQRVSYTRETCSSQIMILVMVILKKTMLTF